MKHFSKRSKSGIIFPQIFNFGEPEKTQLVQTRACEAKIVKNVKWGAKWGASWERIIGKAQNSSHSWNQILGYRVIHRDRLKHFDRDGIFKFRAISLGSAAHKLFYVKNLAKCFHIRADQWTLSVMIHCWGNSRNIDYMGQEKGHKFRSIHLVPGWEEKSCIWMCVADGEKSRIPFKSGI